MNNVLDTKNVLEISGIFEIPPYQRGYRWGEEATKLLDDLIEFDPKDRKHYCLQPIVVKKIGNERYELIDGQQRMTTLFLILTVLKKKVTFLEIKFEIDYQIRDRCKEFLKTISSSSEESNIDFYYIKQAYLAIERWFEHNIGSEVRHAFHLATLLETSVDVIWYEIDSNEDGVQLFKNLNIGKIPLTSSELVKAMFISETSGSPITSDKKDQISFQWDLIEKELHNESFWRFLTNDNYQPRIDLVLNLNSGCSASDKDKYATFYYYDNKRKAGSAADMWDIWNEIQHTYLILKDWYNNHDLYHLIGFLTKTDVSLHEIYQLSFDRTKTEFVEALKEKIKAVIKSKNKNYGELSYRNANDYKKISKLLLLFNVVSTMNHGKKSERFAFDRYVEEKWSLEHIHAQQSEGMEKVSEWKEWLRLHVESVAQISHDSNLVDEMNRYSEETTEITREVFEQIRERVEAVLSADSNIGNLHTISNLALLKREDNSALNNSTFDVKRKRIIELDKEGQFIPYCTKMVFLKYYSSSENNQIHFWGAEDRKNYVDEINRVLCEYLDEQVEEQTDTLLGENEDE